jgi:hypothetical protein
MIGMTEYITEGRWADIFLVWYVLVDDGYQELVQGTGKLRQRGPEPRFSDSEVITVALITDTFFHGNEELSLAFVRQYHLELFPELLEDSRFNRRRKALMGVTEAIRQQYSRALIESEDEIRLVDSAPIPVCTYMRGNQCRTVTGAAYCGFMSSRRAKFFGFRFCATTTTDQVLEQWMLAPASYHDGTLTPALFEDTYGLWVLGDNAFHNPASITWLQKQRQISLVGMQRADARQPWSASLRRHLARIRRRIESAFSVLSTVFHLQLPRSRSLPGLLTRTASIVLAYTLSFFLSHFFSPS